jgi:DNA primase
MEIINKLKLKKNKKGKFYMGTCPFCNTKKVFTLSLIKEIYKCWGCNKSGHIKELENGNDKN